MKVGSFKVVPLISTSVHWAFGRPMRSPLGSQWGRGRRVVTSPLKRARQTAAIISKACDCALVEDERLMELNYGEWDGMPLADVPPSFWKSWRSDIAFTPPGGESLADVALRMHEVMAECSDSGEELVLVTHVAPIKAAVAAVLAAPPETVWNMFLDTVDFAVHLATEAQR